MHSVIGNFRRASFLLPWVLLLPAGCLLRLLEPAMAPTTVRREQWVALAGHGGLPALFGGLRSVVAGGFWLRANLAWERQDLEGMVASVELTVAADERPAYFWLNGARMIAYDPPAWLPDGIPAAVRQQAEEELAQRALLFLEKGLRWRGSDADLLIEIANLHLRRRGDLINAAHYYRLAAELPGAPFHAARIHAELLHRQGRTREALAWLQDVLPGLPADEPAARRGAVEARIAEWERELAGP